MTQSINQLNTQGTLDSWVWRTANRSENEWEKKEKWNLITAQRPDELSRAVTLVLASYRQTSRENKNMCRRDHCSK